MLRLVSVDLKCKADVTTLAEVFDFAKDYLGLLKAAVIAAGIVPPGLEGSGQSLADVLGRLVGPGLGLEIVSKVNDIPKGSRLAVSTNLLAAIITACMRATGQIQSLTGRSSEAERQAGRGPGHPRRVAGRLRRRMAGLRRHLAGRENDRRPRGRGPAIPEFGVSRGRLLARPSHLHRRRGEPADAASRSATASCWSTAAWPRTSARSWKWSPRNTCCAREAEWQARQEAMAVMRSIEAALCAGRRSARSPRATTRNFFGPIQTIIPWASNHYTETLIDRGRGALRPGLLGFPDARRHLRRRHGLHLRSAAQDRGPGLSSGVDGRAKRELQHALPFAMEPVVYDFADQRSAARWRLWKGGDALMPPGYYAIARRSGCGKRRHQLEPGGPGEIARFAAACRTHIRGWPARSTCCFAAPCSPAPATSNCSARASLQTRCSRRTASIRNCTSRSAATCARAGSAWPRTGCRASTVIEDVRRATWSIARPSRGHSRDAERTCRRRGEAALAGGEVAVLTLAAGAGSRWTQGAGVVKALHPFCRFQGRYRNFIEVHLAKSRRDGAPSYGADVPHVISTSYLTHEPIERSLRQHGELRLSAARCCSRRAAPSDCGWSPWPATCASPGRRCRSRFSTCRRRRSARACTPR